jgi:hypothetical protein
MQGPQRERRAHTGNETGTKLKSKHKTKNKKNRKCKFTKRNDADAGQHKAKSQAWREENV